MSRYSFGRKATPVHEKSMGTYEVFAWRDATSIADWINEEFGAAYARQEFEKFELVNVISFERKHQDLLADFIQKTENQRPSFLKRIGKEADEPTRILFVTLALIGVLRAKNVMEVRDNFRSVLAPGRGNRVTTASVYAFAEEIRDIFTYVWPSEVFDAMSIDDESDDE